MEEIATLRFSNLILITLHQYQIMRSPEIILFYKIIYFQEMYYTVFYFIKMK